MFYQLKFNHSIIRIALGYTLSVCPLVTCLSQTMTELLTIRNEESVNTKTLEYAPILFNNQLVFTSTRPANGNLVAMGRDEKKQFSDLYIAEKSEGDIFLKAQKLPGKASSPYHDGVATFNKAGTEMFFTRSNQNGKNEKNIINLKIYSAQFINNGWQNIQELPLNDEAFSNCHPALSPDGQALYFASNRPGGYGGMDLYVSENINGIWQQPKNLGPTINSSSNELFPFISTANNLYFAANNEKSFGGLDIFKAAQNKTTTSFSTIKNLGTDFNTSADEFGFCANETETAGYFTSNRRGGKGGDDIYHWEWEQVEVTLAPMQMSLTILDARSQERVVAAKITIFDEGVTTTKNDVFPIAKMVSLEILKQDNPYKELEKKDYKTGSKGQISVIIDQEKSYTVFVEKKGYTPLKKIITASELVSEKNWTFSLEKKAGIPLKVKAINIPSRAPVAQVSLELLNHCTQKIERAISDDNGQFVFYLACDCEYELIGKKAAYRNYQKRFTTKYRDCGNLNAIQTELYLVEQEVIAHIEKADNLRFPNINSFESQGTQKEGLIIGLPKIVFSENKATISTATAEQLYKIHYFLQTYPHINVELSVHTDARGSAKYNHRLAQKRADNIAAFLLSQGIKPERLSAIGYGEDKLLNQCSDGIRCTEEEHLQNMRVEMKLTKINRLPTDYLLGQR